MYRYIDLHSDTVTMLRTGENLEKNRRMVNIERMRAGGTYIQCFSAFVPTGYFPKRQRSALGWLAFRRIADRKDRLLGKHAELIPVLTYEDALNIPEDKTGVIFTIEDAGVIGNDINKLDRAYSRGVRIASLTWNHENELAYPNSRDETVMCRGLKPFGFEAVERMNALGIIPDVSHLSDGGFRDVIKTSTKPVIATHSNSRTLTAHPRNLTDEMIKALADKGGVTGLNFCPQFLGDDDTSRIEDMIRHLKHIRSVGGAEVLAIGTDFDGISGTLEIGSPNKMPLLFEAMEKAGFTERETEAVCRGNFLRVLRESL